MIARNRFSFCVRPKLKPRTGVFDATRYMQACVRQRTAPSGLFCCPGIRLDYIALDSMHCGDLGLFPDAIGGLLYIEMSHRPWHSSFAVGVAWFNKQLQEYYSANPQLTRVHLTVNMIKHRDDTYP